MFTKVKSAYQVIGVMLFLIAMYLVLSNDRGAQKLIDSVFGGGTTLARTLQGRD